MKKQTETPVPGEEIVHEQELALNLLQAEMEALAGLMLGVAHAQPPGAKGADTDAAQEAAFDNLPV